MTGTGGRIGRNAHFEEYGYHMNVYLLWPKETRYKDSRLTWAKLHELNAVGFYGDYIDHKKASELATGDNKAWEIDTAKFYRNLTLQYLGYMLHPLQDREAHRGLDHKAWWDEAPDSDKLRKAEWKKYIPLQRKAMERTRRVTIRRLKVWRKAVGLAKNAPL